MERTNNPRYGTSCFTNCSESIKAFSVKYTKRIYENRENMKAKFFRLSHDVVTCDVDREVSTAYC